MNTESDMHRGEETEGEDGYLQTKECLRLLGAGERPGTDPSLAPSEGPSPAGTWLLDFWPPELWDNKFVFLNHPVGGTVL